MTDLELIQKALGNDIECFAELIKRYEAPLLRYILRISSFSEEEAEEILQEAFIKAWSNLNDFDQDIKFSSWIYRIVHNQTISEFRKAKSRAYDKKVDLENELFENLGSEIDLVKQTNTKLNQEILARALYNLKIKYREILVLRYLEEKSYDEISDIIKKPQGTVATMLNRAKKQLKEKLEKIDFKYE
ncbi:MAG: RNA polymerase sigma factor [Candidatus Gracilibacteria bacterium]|jgi:RNA polymerase sigma-70 factor (ECF subfamily)|nr:RNA polymerase sigma factor [Candidatus Gracilibacteria bacterium]